jgi:putative endonuclease
MFYCYILKSKFDGSLCKGQTENIEERLRQHNAGKSKYTSGKIPWELVYFEEFKTREESLLREKYLKSAAGRRFIKKLNL